MSTYTMCFHGEISKYYVNTSSSGAVRVIVIPSHTIIITFNTETDGLG